MKGSDTILNANAENGSLSDAILSSSSSEFNPIPFTAGMSNGEGK